VKYSELFKGSFLKAADLGGKPRRYTIDSVGMEKVGDDQKPVIRFQEADQSLVLNKTNGSVLREAWGDEIDNWVGNQVILKTEKTTFSGKLTDCIRVAVPQKKTPPAVEPEEEDDTNV
jgi:hypothetical protein